MVKKYIHRTFTITKEDILTLEYYRRLYALESKSKALRDILLKIRKNMEWDKKIKEEIKLERCKEK